MLFGNQNGFNRQKKAQEYCNPYSSVDISLQPPTLVYYIQVVYNFLGKNLAFFSVDF